MDPSGTETKPLNSGILNCNFLMNVTAGLSKFKLNF